MEYIGCLLCGVPKKMSEFSDCYREADKLGIELIKINPKEKHMWWQMKARNKEDFDSIDLNLEEE